jgi:hypothetical protein
VPLGLKAYEVVAAGVSTDSSTIVMELAGVGTKVNVTMVEPRGVGVT